MRHFEGKPRHLRRAEAPGLGPLVRRGAGAHPPLGAGPTVIVVDLRSSRPRGSWRATRVRLSDQSSIVHVTHFHKELLLIDQE
jgi:hypothetical protein